MFKLIVLIVFLNFYSSNAYEIWPHPKSMKMDNNSFLFVNSNDFRFIKNVKGDCKILDNALKRYYTHRLFVEDCSQINEKFRENFFLKNQIKNIENIDGYFGNLMNLTIEIMDECEMIPKFNMNESYKIIIDKNNSKIYSKSVWGSLRGLETFSQMLEHVGVGQFKVYLGYIDDEPRFKYRGNLIDSSRHYLPLHTIYETLDAMEMNKLNVFHWHIVDNQAFPFVSEKFPSLSAKGSYREHYIYTKKDVNNVLNYAHDRGIRVVVEFDTPGHTLSWGKGQPDLLTKCFDNKGKPIPNSFGPIDPISNKTYKFMEEFFDEIAFRFPDQYLHLGGDEVDFSCWRSNPLIKEFMKVNNYGDDYSKIESYYIKKLIDIVQNLNRSYIVWQEVFDNNVDIGPETVVHVWKEPQWQQEIKKVTIAGHQALLSSCWYLNRISYGTDWYKYYQCDPQNFNGTEQEQNLVIGGAACMWGEFVDASNLISRTWPRACAVAERLWSPKEFNNANKAKSRFHRQRCRMQLLGLKVQPIEGPDYCQCDDAL